MADKKSDSVIIKKYSNRRLYDTSQSCYITLEDLAQIVSAGTWVHVQDAKSGQDLTRQVLTQVILEQDERLNLLPVQLLHSIIRAQGTLDQGPLGAFLASAASQLASAGQIFTPGINPLWSNMGFGGSPAPTPAPTPAPEPAPEAERAPADLDEEIDMDKVRERMNALLNKLGKK
ncbi:MAG: polyhydroxyalkanoate synthesis repressor PhaR [Deltaproteobacteria bacterium]|nr:polyhydroxyalkanoate synthesis repressor PhaR [Deltaproteobacteria bacterium]